MGAGAGLRAAVGLGALALSARRARRRTVDPDEETCFRLINDAPDSIHPPAWVVMQSGSLASVLVVSGLVYRRHGQARAIATLVPGLCVWGGVKIVKPLIGRGRPADHLEHVHVRGQSQSGLGYPSGHAAVAVALACVATTGGWRRAVALAVALVTGTARVYVGAHLPADVVGGFAIGAIAGVAANSCSRR